MPTTRKPRVKKIIRAKTPKRVKFSKEELSLLEHPPTESTWRCPNHSERAINGTNGICIWCGEAKPKTARMLWPVYVEACKKLQIEPLSGTWVQLDLSSGRYFKKGAKRSEVLEIPFVGVSRDVTTDTVVDIPIAEALEPKKRVVRKKR